MIDPKVVPRRFPGIEHGVLPAVRAVVIHQSDSSKAEETFNSYRQGGNGAHFLIEKNGTIYQTASLHRRCFHVGRLIKSRCLALNTGCDSVAMAKILALSWIDQIKAIDAHERAKTYPARYPVNSETVGVELVGKHIDDQRYEIVTALQTTSLVWLLREIYALFKISSDDVFRHPEVSYKNPGEAKSAVWK